MSNENNEVVLDNLEEEVEVPEIEIEDPEIRELLKETEDQINEISKEEEELLSQEDSDPAKLDELVDKRLELMEDANKKFFKTMKSKNGVFDKEYIINKLNEFKNDEKFKDSKALQDKVGNMIYEYQASDSLDPLLSSPPNMYGFFRLPKEDDYSDLFNQTQRKLKNVKKYQFYDIQHMEECINELIGEKYSKFSRVFLNRFFNYISQTSMDKCALFVSNVIINTYKYIKIEDPEDKDFINKEKFINSIISIIKKCPDFKEEVIEDSQVAVNV